MTIARIALAVAALLAVPSFAQTSDTAPQAPTDSMSLQQPPGSAMTPESGGMGQPGMSQASNAPAAYPNCTARMRDRCQQTAAQEARATSSARRRR